MYIHVRNICIFSQDWFDVGSPSATLAQHQISIGSAGGKYTIQPPYGEHLQVTNSIIDPKIERKTSVDEHTALQSQKAVSAHFKSKQLLPFVFAEQYTATYLRVHAK